jgi:hypothetical protein
MVLVGCADDFLLGVVLYLVHLKVLSFGLELILGKQVGTLYVVYCQSLPTNEARDETVFSNPVY